MDVKSSRDSVHGRQKAAVLPDILLKGLNIDSLINTHPKLQIRDSSSKSARAIQEGAELSGFRSRARGQWLSLELKWQQAPLFLC